jgi:hypothetical protein
MWDYIKNQPFDDRIVWRGNYVYQSYAGTQYFCSLYQYGRVIAGGQVTYHKKIGSTYYPRPNLPERIYTLGKDNQIYDGYAPTDKRIYPVQQKIFESEYLATAQLNAVYELVNTRFVENIILTDDKVISPIPLEDIALNTLIRAYDINGEYKELPVSERRIIQDAKGYKEELKLGFKKTKLTEIIKNDLEQAPIVKSTIGSSGSSTIIENQLPWVEETEPNPNQYKTWFRPVHPDYDMAPLSAPGGSGELMVEEDSSSEELEVEGASTLETNY